MSVRVLLRAAIAAAIGFGIGLAAQAKGITPAHAHEAPLKIERSAN
jgi:hypothetical protein